MSALARELEEARKRAGDAEEAAYALRMTLAASERDAAYAHAARRAAEVERDRAATDRDNAQDDARRWCNELRDLAAALGFAGAIDRVDFGEADLVALYEWRDAEREARAAAEATLREHEIALTRATAERDKLADNLDGAESALRDAQGTRGVRLLDACAALTAHGCSLRIETRGGECAWVRDGGESFAVVLAKVAADVGHLKRPEPAPQPEALQLCTPEAPEPPHRVGDVWRFDDGKEHVVKHVSCGDTLDFGSGAAGRAVWLQDEGWRRVRCAPEAPKAAPTLTGDEVRALLVEGDAVAADLKRCMRGKVAPYKAALAVGDPVRVRPGDREAVGTVTRSPADGTLEAWRVAGAEGQEFYAREADIERVAVKP